MSLQEIQKLLKGECNTFILVLLTLTALVHTDGATTTEYWVRPDVESECPLYTPQHQCVTITDLVISSTNSSLNQGSNVTVHFLPGVHTPRVEGRVFVSDESENAPMVSIAATLEGEVNKSVIHCLQKKITFIFANISVLKVKSLNIINCGFETEINNYTSAVTAIFTKRAALKHILIDQVTLSHSIGFGVYIFLLQENSSLLTSDLIITNSSIQYSNNCYGMPRVGGNVLISISFVSLYIRISSSIVSHGCSGCIQMQSEADYLFGGLAIIALDSTIEAELEDSLFEKNEAVDGGGINVAFIKSYIFITIITSAFIQNEAIGCGGGIYYSPENKSGSILSLEIGDSTFLKNKALKHGGGIYIGSFIDETIFLELNIVKITLYSSVFHQNTANVGGAISMNYNIKNTKNLILNCTFFKNSAKEAGAAIALRLDAITTIAMSRFTQHGSADKGCIFLMTSTLILENSQITDNICGGLYISKSTVLIVGTVLIAKNYAKDSSGGGIYLECNEWWVPPTQFSKLLVHIGSHLMLMNNTADKFGGGIYIDYECSKSDKCLVDSKFIFLLHNMSFKVQISLINNTALEAGNTIFGGNFDKNVCKSWKLSDTEKDGFSSFPKYACTCSSEMNTCKKELIISASLFQGQVLKVPIMCIGQLDLPSPCTIRAKTRTIGVKIASESKLQDVGMQCKNISFVIKIYTYDITEILVELESEPTYYVKNDPVKIQITINNCPLGFTTTFNSNQLSCDCTDLIKNEEIRCDINNSLIFKPGRMWVGNFSGEITTHQNCPRDYCKSDFTDVHPNNQQEQCALNRSGVLCGACQPGLSLVLGTSLCKECSNLNLLLLILFALAGIVLVLFLLKCNLTVSTGTFNGLVFYANIIQANKSLFFPPEYNNTFVYILSVFIAWLNLDLGIETCFIGGLNMYYRTWLQFVFPVYIWLLAGLIILTSRYSITISNWSSSNIVQVLATLFLLSYAKLLRVTIDIFSSTPLRNTNGTTLIWLLDGNYMFLNGPHAVLFMAALVTLLVHIIPFTVLLLFSTTLQQYSHHKPFKWVNKLKPLLDAYHGPYKDNSRQWTGLLLLVRLILFSAVAANVNSDRATSLVIISTTMLLISTYAWTKADKLYMQKFSHFLEIFFIANMLLFSVSSLYLASDKARLRYQDILVCCMIGSALGAFVLIIGYHSFLLCINTQNGKALYQKIFATFTRKQRSNDQEDNNVLNDDIIISTSFQSTSHIELKEPLLEDN